MKFAVSLRFFTLFRLLFTFLFLPFPAVVYSQLCQGSLGDPIVNITFGSGTNPGPPVAAAQNIQYQASDCPNDGFYTVRTVSNSCFGSTWHSLADHTNPGSGYFMLINGSYQPSVFYLETVQNLCSGTTYEFAAWLVNVQQPTACNGNIILPNVSFSIEKTDGTVIQSYSTGNIAATSFAAWRQYGFFFTTPSGISDIVLRITNNAPGGCGNDIGLDDITFRPCGPQVAAAITGATSDTASICQGTARNFQFNATISGSSTTAAYQWQQRTNGGNWTDIAGAITTTYNATIGATTSPGLYEYRLGTADVSNIGFQRCRIYSKALGITVNATPVVDITTSGPACAGKAFQLKATGGNTYSWMGPNGFTATDSVITFPGIQPAQNGAYTVTTTSTASCLAAKTFTIDVKPAVTVITSFSDTTICQKATLQLTATGGDIYRWAPAIGLSNANVANPVATGLDTTHYQVVAVNSFGCADTGYVTVNVIRLAIADAGPDKTIVSSLNAVLEGSIQNRYEQFYWQPASGLSNARQLQPQVTAVGDAVYWLTAVSPNGCGTSIDTVNVKVYKDIYIPSAFTPNGDGKNDLWNIPALQAFSQFELLVYNRYGQLVFQSRNQYQPWNGKTNGTPLPAGAYVYFLSITDLKKSWKGTVMIIR